MNFRRLVKSSLVSALLLVPFAVADVRADMREQDEVHGAVERGEIRSLTDILNDIRGKLPGDVVGVEIEEKDGHWVYEFRTIDSKGRLFEVYVDARTSKIEKIKEK